jgi:medium-chain acyl-[acyl-carrier-protein] hydrolase
LPDDIEVIAVQLPGREPPSQSLPLDSIAAMVDAVLPAIAAAVDDVPFALFGHSMGALVAFETTVALEAGAGPLPSMLFVSGRRSPDELQHAPPIDDLADGDFLDELQVRYGGVPDVVRREPELVALLLPGLRADVRAFETYSPLTTRMVECPVHVYGGRDDLHPRVGQLHGWQRVARQPIRVRTFPGDHFYLSVEREALVADIDTCWSNAAVRAEGG